MTALSAPNPLKLRPLSLKPLALAALLACQAYTPPAATSRPTDRDAPCFPSCPLSA